MKDGDGYGERLKDPVFWMGFWAWRKTVEVKSKFQLISYNGHLIGITVGA